VQKLYGSTAQELWGLQRAPISLEYLTTNREIHVVTDNIGVTSLHKLRIGNARKRRLLAHNDVKGMKEEGGSRNVDQC